MVTELVENIAMAQNMRQQAFRGLCAALSRLDLDDNHDSHAMVASSFGSLIGCLKSEWHAMFQLSVGGPGPVLPSVAMMGANF